MYDPKRLKQDVQRLVDAGEFDPEWYLETYEDVQLLGMAPAEHYIKYGKLMGRLPNGRDALSEVKAQDTDPAHTADVDIPTEPEGLPEEKSDIVIQPLALPFASQTFAEYAGPKKISDIPEGTELPKVSFVLTAYNAEKTIEKSVTSLLNQSYPNLEVVVCDDFSSDSTWNILQEMKARAPNALQIIRVNQNGGTYLAKNIAIAESTGEIIMFQDSDDYSHPERAMLQILPLLAKPELIATRTKYLRFSAETRRIIPVADLYSKFGLITLAVRRSAFNEIGFFDTVRKAGDDEWFQRLSHFFGKERIKNVNVSLYLAELRENSLIADMLTFRDDGSVDQSSSNIRRQYVSTFKARFKDKKKNSRWFRNSFSVYPLRPNRTYPDTVAALENLPEKVYASACCIPERIASFERIVARLLPQVDGLFVFLDKFDTIPEFLENNPKITVTLSSDVEGDPRDNAKFFAFNKLKAAGEPFFYFTCDDDILYPYDYVRTLISRLQAYDNKAVVGVHGVMYEEAPRKYFRRRFIYHFRETPLSRPHLVNNLGTGTVAFHSDCFDTIDHGAWDLGGMVDIFFSKECRARNIPMLCIDRHAHWMRDTEESSGTPNLFVEFSNKEEKIIKELKSMQPWGYQAIHKTVAQQPPALCGKLQVLLPMFSDIQHVSQFFPRYR